MNANKDIVVITGASAGVGRATAYRFARAGCAIGLVARNEERLEDLKKEVEMLGGRAVVCVADVANDGHVEAAAEKVERELGPITIWINNAMASVFSPVKEMTNEEIRRVTEVTYLGVVYGTMAALRRMLPRNRGSIVQVGSALAYRGIPLQAAYCGAKHAIQGFMDSLRTELLHDGSRIKTCMVQLPALNTPQFSWVRSRLPNKPQPVPPIYQPEVAADAIHWAAYHNRRELLVGWPTVRAVVGDKLAPSLADRYLAKKGYKMQQTEDPAEYGRKDNLWESVSGKYGAHGEFDAQSISRSPMTQFLMHRNKIALAIGAALLAGRMMKKGWCGGLVSDGK